MKEGEREKYCRKPRKYFGNEIGYQIQSIRRKTWILALLETANKYSGYRCYQKSSNRNGTDNGDNWRGQGTRLTSTLQSPQKKNFRFG